MKRHLSGTVLTYVYKILRRLRCVRLEAGYVAVSSTKLSKSMKDAVYNELDSLSTAVKIDYYAFWNVSFYLTKEFDMLDLNILLHKLGSGVLPRGTVDSPIWGTDMARMVKENLV